MRSIRTPATFALTLAVAAGSVLIGVPPAGAHGTCADHQYQTTDGTHDTDNDGIGCESLPPAPSSSPSPSPAPAPAPAGPIAVGGASTKSGGGVWVGYTNGDVQQVGSAPDHGDVGGAPLNAPVVGLAPTASGGGYWLLARDGGVFSYGDAGFLGSAVGRSSGPFSDLTTAARGGGYWLTTTEGTVSAFGTAAMPSTTMAGASNAPVTGIEANPAGDGLWLATGGEAIGDFGVTCYALRGTTASGAPVGRDVVAVDPRSVPLGSEIFLGGHGVKRALDTGGAIKGRRLDIWNPSAAFCREFGVQRLTAYTVH